jgi:hypothetical protein
VSEAYQVLGATRASDRQRQETMTRIRYARREGRLTRALSDARLEAASQAVTTADLARLTSDLGPREGANLVRTLVALLSVVITGAAWEPVLLSGKWWLALAVPVTLMAAYLIWVLWEYVA